MIKLSVNTITLLLLRSVFTPNFVLGKCEILYLKEGLGNNKCKDFLTDVDLQYFIIIIITRKELADSAGRHLQTFLGTC